MRVLTIFVAATILALPAATPAGACEAGLHSAKAVAIDYSAAKKKKKTTAKKEKVEYMRAAPMK